MAMQTFGEMIRVARRVKGISMEAVGAAIGMSTTHVSYMERGIKNPPPDQVIRKWLIVLGEEDALPRFLEAASSSAHRIAIYTGGKDRRATVAFVKIAKRYEANALSESEIKKLETLAQSLSTTSEG